MVYVWGPAVIGGVAAAGAVFLFFSIGLLVVVGLRIRHRRKLAAINAADERRLSRYPGGNLSLVDGDFNEIPGSHGFLQRPGYDPYGPTRVWTAIPSRESIQARPVTWSPPKAVTSERTQQENDPSQLSWPLPRRLTRFKAIELVPIKQLPLSPITERSATNPEPSPAIVNTIGFPVQKTLGQVQDNIGQALSSDGIGNPQPGVWPTAAPKPTPLFPGQQRSLSAEPMPLAPVENVASSLGIDANPRDSFPFASRRPELPRSVSFGSQSSGVAPDGPVPPLPANARKSSRPDKTRVNAAGSPSRTSVGSFASGRSSILQNKDRASQTTSQAETDFTSLSLLSPHSGLRIYDGSKTWDPSRMSSTANSPGPSATTNIQTQLLTQRSFRASIGGYSLPRSTSSGLSISLLDQHTPKAEPGITSFSNVQPIFNGIRNLEIPRSNPMRRQSPRERTLATLTSNRRSLFNVYDDVRNKRASTSILQDVSGNQSSPLRNELAKRPTSIATSNPFQWDPATSMKPVQLAAYRGWRRGHKRQNCVRMSNLTPLSTPGRFLPTLEEPDEQPQASTEPPGPHAKYPPMSQPAALDPSIEAQTRPSHPTRPAVAEGPYSPTLAMVNLYSSDSDSSDATTEPSTPTRKPPHHRTTSQRRRNLFTSASRLKLNAWPILSTPSRAPRTALPPSPPSNPNLTTSHPPTPLSPILHFPPPPLGLPLRAPPCHLFRDRNPSPTPIRGPRAPPSPTRTHTTRAHTTRAEKRLSPMRDLRKSVMALRRMNSEVSETDARASRRYLRMGTGGCSPLPDANSLTPSRSSSIMTREPSARSALGMGRDASIRSGLGREASVRSGLGLGSGRENSVMGGMVIEEEEAGTRKSEENGVDSLARVEMELKRLREMYPVREREMERERERDMERESGSRRWSGELSGGMKGEVRTPTGRGEVGRGGRRGQWDWGTPGSLYDREGFWKD